MHIYYFIIETSKLKLNTLSIVIVEDMLNSPPALDISVS